MFVTTEIWQHTVLVVSVDRRISWCHSLLDCNMSKCIWALEKEEIVEFLCQITVFESLSQEEVTRVTVTLWAIWYARRKAIREQIFQSPLSTHGFINKFVSDLDMCKVHGEGRGSKAEAWCSPKVDTTTRRVHESKL